MKIYLVSFPDIAVLKRISGKNKKELLLSYFFLKERTDKSLMEILEESGMNGRASNENK